MDECRGKSHHGDADAGIAADDVVLDSHVVARDVDTGQARGVPLEGHAGPSVTTSYSPDGELLARSGTDGRVIVRDAETGRQLGVPLAASDNVYTMAIFDPEGRLFVASGDGAMWLWDMDLDSWLERACLTAGRGLSRDEWSDLDTGRDYEPACP